MSSWPNACPACGLRCWYGWGDPDCHDCNAAVAAERAADRAEALADKMRDLLLSDVVKALKDASP